MQKIWILIAFLLAASQTNATEPEESGKIPIVTYHRIDQQNSEYTRSRASFYSDLKNFKKYGFHLISLAEFHSGKISAPKGKIPLLMTFDDSSETQFKYNDNGSISETCGMHIMEKFQKENADYPLRAVFFVLPGAAYPNNLFGQPQHNKKKLDFLVSRGYEIASHTLWHADMKKYRAKIEEQLAMAQYEVSKYLKNYPLYALALPYGIFPPKEDRHRLRQGTYKGKKYKHDLVFDYSNRLSDSVYDKNFNPNQVKRLHGNVKVFEKLFSQAQKQKHIFFISDGDPNTITVRKENREKIKTKTGFQIKTY